jgi:hypothetical protein
MLLLSTEAGWTSAVSPWSRLRRNKRDIQWGLRCSQEKCRAGVPPILALKTIRFIIDQPQRLTRIALVFEEAEAERTQEFVLRLSPDGGRSFREIVRQQWNFSPPSSIREVEEYQVGLSDVTVVELVIVPDISRGSARTSLKNLRVS